MTTRWLFADQLGPQFLDTPDQPALLVESRAVFRRRRFHRAKAHLLLSGLRHRAHELGEQAVYLTVDTYDEALAQVDGELSVVQPTSYAADRFVRERGIEVVPEGRGFATTREDFAGWVSGRRRLLLEDFYRWQRVRFDLLMEGSEPAGGQWNLDHDNREPPPKRPTLGLPEPWEVVEDDIDAGVREDLDRMVRDGRAEFVGEDAPRWAAVTRWEAQAALAHFVEHRLRDFGPTEDAMLARDPWMSHSALSPAINLGLLHPLECVHAAEQAYREGRAPLNSVEGYVRQVIGWREYIWSLYWHFPQDYRRRNALQATEELPEWFRSLDADAVTANCLSSVLRDLRERGWVHHIPRLMVLGNYGLQRGWDPAQLTAWFHEVFVDGYDWVMLPNVTGMSQHADGGLMTTKPYAAGGAYINRMSDYCGGCAYDPKVRVGPTACPYTAGYWAFLDRNEQRLQGNNRMRQPLQGLTRLKDRHELVEQERRRGNAAP
ncbi:MAG TPA: cryptochrome/photolyase family protein [Mycobacteriales bacterium]|jgi:deoxyribodipyrimidine photolyase-related protein|nr:cryptochrome/photolyase family protein [Mycobacteriales bacterium]